MIPTGGGLKNGSGWCHFSVKVVRNILQGGRGNPTASQISARNPFQEMWSVHFQPPPGSLDFTFVQLYGCLMPKKQISALRQAEAKPTFLESEIIITNRISENT